MNRRFPLHNNHISNRRIVNNSNPGSISRTESEPDVEREKHRQRERKSQDDTSSSQKRARRTKDPQSRISLSASIVSSFTSLYETLSAFGIWNIPTSPDQLFSALQILCSVTALHIWRMAGMVFGWLGTSKQDEKRMEADEDGSVSEDGSGSGSDEEGNGRLKMKVHGKGGEAEAKTVKRRRAKPNTVYADATHFPGMVNLSGTLCYMNSVLQAFASIPSLLKHLEKIVELAEIYDLPTPVTDALLDVLLDLNTPATRPPPALRPIALLHALQTLPAIRRLLNTREQQDAHELFLVLAEAVSNEAMKVAAQVMRVRGLGEVITLQRFADQKSDDNYSASSPTAATRRGQEKKRGLAQPWEGLISRRRVCKRCGWCEAVRMDTLGGMELSVPQHGDATLEACIAQYLSPEHLSEVTCEMCSLRMTLAHYIMDADRLSTAATPKTSGQSQSDANTDVSRSSTKKSPTPSMSSASLSSFSALSHLSSNSDGLARKGIEPSDSSMTTSRKKRARDAKRVQVRLQAMLEAGTVASFGEPTLPPTPTNPSAVPIKWQTARTDSLREAAITRPPPTLRLHLIRSEYTPYGQLVKKTGRVAFPAVLDLTPFVANGVWEDRSVLGMVQQSQSQSQQQEPTTESPGQRSVRQSRVLYRLESAILHYGYNHSSGHYVCLRRKPQRIRPSQQRDGSGENKAEEEEMIYRPRQIRKSCPDGCGCQSCMYFGQVRQDDPGPRASTGVEDEVYGPGRGWLRISDADVEEVGEEVLRESMGQVFMLFYERVGEYEP